MIQFKPCHLSRSELLTILAYDPVAGVFLWKINRRGYRGIKIGDRAGSITKSGYRSIRIDGIAYRASRLAWFMDRGVWPIAEIDHKNTTRNDDRMENLREASTSQNHANSNLRRDNTAGAKGIRRMVTGRWQARITVKGKELSLGSFDTKTAALQARRAAAGRLFGEFAREDAHPRV